MGVVTRVGLVERPRASKMVSAALDFLTPLHYIKGAAGLVRGK